MDEQAFRDYLTELKSTITGVRDERVTGAPEDHEDTTLARLNGGLQVLGMIESQLSAMALRPRRTAVEDIKTPTVRKVREKALSTSWDAAVSQTPEKSRRTYKAIQLVLSNVGPMTDDQLIAFFAARSFAHSESGVRARRSELRDAGWVRDSGRKAPSKNGHPSTVWEVVPS